MQMDRIQGAPNCIGGGGLWLSVSEIGDVNRMLSLFRRVWAR